MRYFNIRDICRVGLVEAKMDGGWGRGKRDVILLLFRVAMMEVSANGIHFLSLRSPLFFTPFSLVHEYR
jgi:hypothetical protein